MCCPKCGKENPETANFCTECGEKLSEVCDCWVKKQPYSCGQSKCPGIKLLLWEMKSSKVPKDP